MGRCLGSKWLANGEQLEEQAGVLVGGMGENIPHAQTGALLEACKACLMTFSCTLLPVL